MEPLRLNTKSNLASTSILLNLLRISTLLLTSLIFTINSAYATQKKLIAITEIVEHPSLQQAKEGILDALKENGFEIGENLEVIEKNAQSSIANALMIAKQFISLKPDAIVPISTPSAQAVVKAAGNKGIPVIFSSVTDPVAAGLVQDLAIATKDVSGAMDYPLIEEEVSLILSMIPSAKKIGFLYNTGEANSVKTIELLKEAIKGKLEYIDSPMANSNQIVQSVSALVGKVDVIYIPSDNTVFASMPKLVQLSRQHKIPVFSSDPDSVKQGVLACIGYTQYEVGRTAGKILARVLKGENMVNVGKPEKVQIFINKITADSMGIVVPDELLGIKTDIIVGEK
ncbi:MAG: ABC transporter substrate-binding protein [Rickettsiaceae bacterium]|jgi:putative ABC transport system substrate-binding protein|nr:ABC transporter substrate-binding protein [Rickettsiaceae bacterium]